jgi:Holliday junction resolvase RusA-like endonuclease
VRRTWRGVILGEPASKANSRRIVRFGSKLRVMKRLPAQDQLLEPIRMTAHLYYASRRPDLDPSLILDALQGRVYRNDRAVREMHLYHHLDRENPRAEILLEEMTDDE